MKSTKSLKLTIVLVVCSILMIQCSSNQLVYIEGNDTMKYSVELIETKPGKHITLTFKATGNLPRSTMAHNWVLLEPNTDVEAFVNAGLNFPDNDYIDPALEEKILVRTKMLANGEMDVLVFKAPGIKGEYDYVCTFPAHYLAGMRGKFIVD